jgi:hypothetical protein
VPDSVDEYRSLVVKFKRDLDTALFDRVFRDVKAAEELWSSLANVGWFHESAPKQEVGYSFRAAGGLIAEMRGMGDYMDWYCCGPDGVVAPWISEAMAKLGWRFEAEPSGADYMPDGWVGKYDAESVQ